MNEKNEKRIVVILALLVPLITVIPIIHGYLSAPDGLVFMGLVSNVADSNTYFDYMNQARDGHFLLRNSYTSEDTPHLLIRPLFWTMGLFTLFLPAIFVFHLFRVGFSMVFILLTHKFLRLFIKDRTQRVITLVIISIGSGLGYLTILLNNVLPFKLGTTDVWMHETIPFLAMNSAPHLIVSHVLLVGIAYLFLTGISDKNNKRLVGAGVLAFILGFVHIYDVVPLFLTIGVYLLYKMYTLRLWDWGLVKRGALFYCIALPSSLYYFFVFTFNDSFGSWAAQNDLSSPHPTTYFFGFGIMLILAITFIIVKRKIIMRNDRLFYLASWIIITFLLLYLPTSIQRRFAEGIFVPLSILGVYGAYTLIKPLSKTMKTVALLFVVLLTIPTNAYMFSEHFMKPGADDRGSFTISAYLTPEEIDVLVWLQENTDVDDVVMANKRLSNYVPRVSGNKVYSGHWAQTIDYHNKSIVVLHFYNGLLSSIVPADYVIAKTDNKLIPDYLEEIYVNKELSIYTNTRG